MLADLNMKCLLYLSVKIQSSVPVNYMLTLSEYTIQD